ncbi:glycosyltransferase [Lutimonas vermicola]|uniref:Glycosyltransferase n=1 Tax=Lutimonas vermicola TaxID=414288 RepID=A0ABU9KYV0_9FLAO
MIEKVSIIIPTHNRKNLLTRAIESLLAQSYNCLEIIVVNDASSDGTDEFMVNLIKEEPRLRYYRNAIPKGAPSSRNLGILNATGKFVTFLDDDDEMLPDKIEVMLKNFKADYSMVATGYFEQKIDRKKAIIPKRIVKLEDLLYYYPLGGGNQMLTLRFYALQIGGFDESLTAYQDYDFWLRIVKVFGNGICIQEPLSIIHMEHEMGRITTSPRRFLGAYSFYLKHKGIMTEKQRRYQLYLLMLLRKRRISLRQFVYMVPLRFWRIRYKYLVLCYFPFLSK